MWGWVQVRVGRRILTPWTDFQDLCRCKFLWFTVSWSNSLQGSRIVNQNLDSECEDWSFDRKTWMVSKYGLCVCHIANCSLYVVNTNCSKVLLFVFIYLKLSFYVFYVHLFNWTCHQPWILSLCLQSTYVFWCNKALFISQYKLLINAYKKSKPKMGRKCK